MAYNLDNTLWRVVNAIAGVLLLVSGFCSYETYELIRSVSHVTVLTPAMVNHNLFWSMGMATLLAVYVYRLSCEGKRGGRWASDRALTIWLVAAVAFLPLPLSMLFVWHGPGVRQLYLGYALKAACFVYLYWLLFRYHVLNDPDTFTDGWTMFHGRTGVTRTANPAPEAAPADNPLSDDQAAEHTDDGPEPDGSTATQSEI